VSKIRLRPLAETDLVERTKYYESQGGRELSEGFFDIAIELLAAIDEMPAQDLTTILSDPEAGR